MTRQKTVSGDLYTGPYLGTIEIIETLVDSDHVQRVRFRHGFGEIAECTEEYFFQHIVKRKIGRVTVGRPDPARDS